MDITTKKGKKGQDAKVSYSGSVAWATPTAKLNFLGAADYAMLYNEAVKNENPNASLPYSDEDIDTLVELQNKMLNIQKFFF